MKRYILCLSLCLTSVLSFAATLPRVGVLDFRANDVSESTAQTIGEMFTSELVSSKYYQVIDRKNMTKLLNEQELQMTGVVDVSGAVKVGKVLSLEYVITGTVGRLGDVYVLNVQMINVTTANIESSSMARIERIDQSYDILRKLVDQLAGKASASISPKIEPVQQKSKEPVGKYLGESNVRYPTFSIGLRGGASGSFLSGPYAAALDASLAERGSLTRAPQPLLSYRADAFFRMGFMGWFALQAEVGFGPIGGGILASNGYDLLVGISANEIRVPVLVVFSLTAPFGTFSLMAGPFVGYSILPPQLIENSGLTYTTSPLQPSIYVGLAGGLEYRLPLGPGSLVVDARYTHRLLSTIVDANALTPLAIELTAGYMITFKK